jgi:hypothetical protein
VRSVRLSTRGGPPSYPERFAAADRGYCLYVAQPLMERAGEDADEYPEQANCCLWPGARTTTRERPLKVAISYKGLGPLIPQCRKCILVVNGPYFRVSYDRLVPPLAGHFTWAGLPQPRRDSAGSFCRTGEGVEKCQSRLCIWCCHSDRRAMGHRSDGRRPILAPQAHDYVARKLKDRTAAISFALGRRYQRGMRRGRHDSGMGEPSRLRGKLYSHGSDAGCQLGLPPQCLTGPFWSLPGAQVQWYAQCLSAAGASFATASRTMRREPRFGAAAPQCCIDPRLFNFGAGESKMNAQRALLSIAAAIIAVTLGADALGEEGGVPRSRLWR